MTAPRERFDGMGERAEHDQWQHRSIPVTGMTCEACEHRVGRALLQVPGVESVAVSARRGAAVVAGAELPPANRIEEAIRAAGYQPGRTPWISRDPVTWATVVVGALAVAAVLVAAAGLGLRDVVGGLASPSGGGLALVLALGLTAGFSTCMAMVGGLVLGFSAAHAASSTHADRPPPLTERMRPQLAFNIGRIAGFAVLGAALGALGSVLSLPAGMMGVLSLAVAVVMVLLGIRLTGVSPRVAAWSPRLPAALAGALGVRGQSLRPYQDLRTALVGAGTFFLPCGVTQAVQVYALSTGSPGSAALIMAAFALGTAPGLFALACVPELAAGRARATVLRLVGVAVLAFALVNVLGGMHLLGISRTQTPVAEQRVSDNVSLQDGVQIVRMTQTPDGYFPTDTVVHADVPIVWSIESTSKWDCSAFLRIPRLGVSVDLQEGPNTVRLPALSPGVVPFTCVMGMYTGNLIAIEPTPGQ